MSSLSRDADSPSSELLTAHSVLAVSDLPEILPFGAFKEHSMGRSLPNYITMRIHSHLAMDPHTSVLIQSPYEREAPAIPSRTEKKDRLFGWQRPTMTPLESELSLLNCFPGRDYVEHYAALIATFFFLKGSRSSVHYRLPSPEQCYSQFLTSNLPKMGEVDIAIVGCVEQLISEKEWYYVRGEADDLFTWHKSRTARGNTVAYLGCKMSLWGDISGYLVRALQEMSKAKCILYIGKTGTLSPDHTPNQTLATGDASCMNGALIKWSNPLKPFIPYSDAIREGVHTTVSSPLVESQAWVEEWQPKCTWVDCEVGHMADAARERGTSFGYLHIVSDRVTDWYPQDLTNEHSLEVTEQRGILFAEIRKVIDRFLESWSKHI